MNRPRGNRPGRGYPECGEILSLQGCVIDVAFDGHLPAIYNELRTGEDKSVLVEVLIHLDAVSVLGVALTSTRGLFRGH